MSGLRARLLPIACGIGLLAYGRLGHAQPASTFNLIMNLGLPPVDVGQIRWDFVQALSERDLRAQQLQALPAGLIGAGGSGPRYSAGHVIVRFRDGMSSARRAAAVREATTRGALAPQPDYANFDLVTIDPADDAEAMAQTFRARADVEYAQADYVVHKMFVPNDPLYHSLQWNLPMIDLERAWDIQPQAGSAITVAVLDTGVAFSNATITTSTIAFQDASGNNYPALTNVTIPYSAAPQLGSPSRFVLPHDFIQNTSTPLDFDGHGTHVSGTIGQLTNDGIGVAGVAFNVKIMPVKVICGEWDVLFGVPADQCGTDSQVAQGIRYAADNGAKVINMSIGRTGPPAPAIEDAMTYAVGKGVFIAVAGGNDATNGNPTEVIADIAGRLAGAVAVAAVGFTRIQAPYSSSGPWIELAAPGGAGVGDDDNEYVWQQTFDFRQVETYVLPVAQYGPPRFDVFGYVGYAGTSMATPHVAGVAAMLMQQGIVDPAAIELALESSAVDLGAPGRDTTYGFGLLEARNALRGLGLTR